MDRATRVRLVAALLTAVGIAGGALLRAGGVPPVEAVDLEAVPRSIGAWQSRDVPVSTRVRAQLRSDALLLRAYSTGEDAPVWALVDYHRTQRLGATVHSPRICYPGAGWRVDRVESGRAGGRAIRWLELTREGERMLAGYWYESRWGTVARETRLKAAIVRSALTRRPTDAAVVRLSTPIEGAGVEEARARLVRFVEEAAPSLRAALPFTQGEG
jgi:EpsI family protein